MYKSKFKRCNRDREYEREKQELRIMCIPISYRITMKADFENEYGYVNQTTFILCYSYMRS